MLLGISPNSNLWIERCGILILNMGREIVSVGTISGGIQVYKGIQEGLTETV